MYFYFAMNSLVYITISLFLVLIISVLCFRYYINYSDSKLVNDLASELNAKSILAVFAHPDDEVSVAQTLINAKSNGAKTGLITLTRGEDGKQKEPICRQKELGDIRRAELLKSGFFLKLDYQKFHDYRDRHLHQEPFDSLVNEVLKGLQEFNPELLVTFYPETGVNLHKDHITAAKATKEALKRYRNLNTNVSVKYVGYTMMNKNLLKVMGKHEVAKIEPIFNYSIKSDIENKIHLIKKIHVSQKHTFQFYGLPLPLVFWLNGKENFFIEKLD